MTYVIRVLFIFHLWKGFCTINTPSWIQGTLLLKFLENKFNLNEYFSRRERHAGCAAMWCLEEDWW